jgi:hypothetical protein
MGRTDASGAFRLDLLTAGRHTLVALRPGYLSRTITLDLAAGETLALPLVELTAGDLRIDSLIDLGDLRVVAAIFDTCRGNAGFNPVVDFDGDGCIGWEDYSLVARHYGRIGPENWIEEGLLQTD